MRTERLFNIVAALLAKDTVSAKALAERFDVSTRTIYRDIDVLSVAGVPIYMKKGRGGGISLVEGYKLENTMLNDKDVESIMMSIGALNATGYKGVEDVMNKFSAIFSNHKTDDWVEIDFTEWDTNKNLDDSFEKIKTAILDRRWISLSYFNSYGKHTLRTLAPLKLHFKARSWYVSAYCSDKKDVRIFKITRMREIVLSDERFQRDKYIEMQTEPKEKNSKIETVNIKMKFKPQAAYLLYDWYGQESIEQQEDGSYLVSATFPMDEWVYSHILSYGDNVEVLEPDFIRREIAARLKNILETYNNKT